jgi:hypothetical protein
MSEAEADSTIDDVEMRHPRAVRVNMFIPQCESGSTFTPWAVDHRAFILRLFPAGVADAVCLRCTHVQVVFTFIIIYGVAQSHTEVVA